LSSGSAAGQLRDRDLLQQLGLAGTGGRAPHGKIANTLLATQA